MRYPRTANAWAAPGQEPGAGGGVLGVEGFGVGEAAVVVDHGVDVFVADSLAGSGVGAFVDSPSASVGDPAQGFDVDMYQLTRAIPHIPDRNPRGAVQCRQTRQPPAGQHRVDRGPWYSEASGHQMRAFSFGETIGRDPVLGLGRQAGGAAPRAGRPVLETGFAFFLEAAQPPVHGLAGHPCCFRRLRWGPAPMNPVYQQPASERCQPASTTLPHEGLLGIADAFTHDSTRQALTNQASPPPEPKSGFIRG